MPLGEFLQPSTLQLMHNRVYVNPDLKHVHQLITHQKLSCSNITQSWGPSQEQLLYEAFVGTTIPFCFTSPSLFDKDNSCVIVEQADVHVAVIFVLYLIVNMFCLNTFGTLHFTSLPYLTNSFCLLGFNSSVSNFRSCIILLILILYCSKHKLVQYIKQCIKDLYSLN